MFEHFFHQIRLQKQQTLLLHIVLKHLLRYLLLNATRVIWRKVTEFDNFRYKCEVLYLSNKLFRINIGIEVI